MQRIYQEYLNNVSLMFGLFLIFCWWVVSKCNFSNSFIPRKFDRSAKRSLLVN